jgi:predicted RNase H-like HicB family nuclease
VRTMEADPRYEIIIYWSAEDEAFIAEVPELPRVRSGWFEL